MPCQRPVIRHYTWIPIQIQKESNESNVTKTLIGIQFEPM